MNPLYQAEAECPWRSHTYGSTRAQLFLSVSIFCCTEPSVHYSDVNNSASE